VFQAIKVLPTGAVGRARRDPAWVVLEGTEGDLKGVQLVVMYRREPEEFGPPRRFNVGRVENVSLKPGEWVIPRNFPAEPGRGSSAARRPPGASGNGRGSGSQAEPTGGGAGSPRTQEALPWMRQRTWQVHTIPA